MTKSTTKGMADISTPALLTPEMVDNIRRANTCDIVDAIDDGDISINARTAIGTSALHIAIDWGREDVTLALLDKGACVNVCDAKGVTPLHAAATTTSMSSDVVKRMLALGADPNARDAQGQTPLHWVSNTHSMLPLIMAGAELDAVNADGETALWGAARSGQISLARMLLEHGAQPNLANKTGQSPLERAVAEDELGVATALIAFGADSSRITDIRFKGLPATHAAVSLGLLPRLQRLLQNGHDPEVVHMEKTAFDEAKDNGRLDGLAMLHAWRAERAMAVVLDAALKAQGPGQTRPGHG